MLLMRWFRRHTKWLMVIFGSLLMVGFLLSGIANQSSRSQADPVFGTYVDLKGQKRKMRSEMLRGAGRELEILSSLGIGLLSRPRLDETGRVLGGVISSNEELGGVNVVAEMAAYQLFFADNQASQLIRYFLEQQLFQAGWADSPEEAQEIREQIVHLTNSDRKEGSRYYLLLLDEARRAGFQASRQQGDAMLQLRGQLQVQLGLPSVTQVRQRLSISENQVRQAIGNYIAIVQYADMLTGSLTVSEGELKREIRDNLELTNVSGTFVTFTSGLFLDQIADPSEEELKTHFEAYKAYDPGGDSEENLYGFGYRLPDRVEMEYLKIDLTGAQALVEQEFMQMSPSDREETVQRYWENNRQKFRIPLPADPAQANQPPAYREPEFDEVAVKAADMWKKQRAREKARTILNGTLAQVTLVGDKSLKAEQMAQAAGEYETFASEQQGEELNVVYGKTDFLSAESMRSEPDFERTYSGAWGRQQQGLLEMLFNCKPLRKGPVSLLDFPPLKLYETAGPLWTSGFSGDTTAVYLMRIIGVDRSRLPSSLDDEGLHGADETAAVKSETNALRERVKEDWKNLQAYALVKRQAKVFADQAAIDWETALTETNVLLQPESEPDPNVPPPLAPLRAETLENSRRSLDQIRQFATNQNSSYFVEAIIRYTTMLSKAMALAQERETDDAQKPRILERPDELSCAVFRDLTVTMPSQEEYLRRKPITAAQLMNRQQRLVALAHFNPVHIDQRHRYVAMNLSDEVAEP